MPGYSCSKQHFLDLPKLLYPSCLTAGDPITYQQFLQSNIPYMAGQDYSTAVIDGNEQEVVRLEFVYGWSETKEQLSCIYYQNTSTVEISYVDGILHGATILKTYGEPLNASYLSSPSPTLLDAMANITAGDVNSPAALSLTSDDLTTINLLGLHDAFALTISGAVLTNGLLCDGQWVANPLLPAPTETYGTKTQPSPFPISELILQNLITNLSMTYLNIFPNEHIEVNATTSNLANTYIFRSASGGQQWHLYGPYAATIIMGFTILSAGLWALFLNGVPAESSLLQVLSTTALADEKLRRAAADCSEGGVRNFSRDLKKLQVRFVDVERGPLLGQDKGTGPKRMAFRSVGGEN